MKGEPIDIINNLIQAVSILNETEEYLDSLVDRLSECDSLISDYQHFIENAEVGSVDTIKLFTEMKLIFLERRGIKNDMSLRDNYTNLKSKMNNSVNRQFLIQGMKNAQSKLNTKYNNRILKEEDIDALFVHEEKKKRGRPPKKEVANNE